MTSLQDQLATLNAVQYSRYRLAFKLRKLQTIFLLDRVDVAGLQDVLHSAGVQGLRLGDEVPLTQLKSALAELYRTVRTLQPLIPANQLQNAQECCYDWLQLAFNCSSGKPLLAGQLKLTLCLFCASKSSDKTRYLFNLLANSNGAIEREGVRYFCQVTQLLARCLGEKLYAGYGSLDQVFRECLVFVRSAEDVEDEELDGGIKRQLLSQFEFGKVFAASDPPPFLAWLALWRQLPALEKVVHPVRCNICTRKPILSLRYQCTQCPNFHMCQMCFLKGRVSSRHALSHSVVEFTSASKAGKSWHHRLLGLPAKPQGGRPFQEPREPFLPASSYSADEVDSLFRTPGGTPGGSIESSPVIHRKVDRQTFVPAVIRIGSADSLLKGAKRPSSSSPSKEASPRSEPLPPQGQARTLSYTSGSSSPDSLSSGSKFSYDGSAGSEPNTSAALARNYVVSSHSGEWQQPAGSSGPRRLRLCTSDSAVLDRPDSQEQESRRLKEVNKRLSMEVDQLLNDLPPPAAISPRKQSPTSSLVRSVQASPPLVADGNLSGSLQKLASEERALQSQVNQLTDKREKLAHELQDLLSQVQQMHYGFVNLSNGVRTPSPSLGTSMDAPVAPMHLRYPSAPVSTTTDPSASLPTIRLLKEAERGLTPPLMGATLLDPLVDFTPDQLQLSMSENPRFSVAW